MNYIQLLISFDYTKPRHNHIPNEWKPKRNANQISSSSLSSTPGKMCTLHIKETYIAKIDF